MSIVAACLPTLASLFRHTRDPASMIRSVRSALSLRSTSSRLSGKGSKTSNTEREQENKDAKHAWLELNSNSSHSHKIAYKRDVESNSLEDTRKDVNEIYVQKSLDFRSESV